MNYEHTQVGYVTGGALTAGALLILYLGFSTGEWSAAMLGALVVVAVCAVLFASLTTRVDDEQLTFYFGPGFWKKSFPVDRITRAEVVRNPFWYGWGIRYTPYGWLYNVSGYRAIEVEIDGELTIRIGTDEPQALQQALNRTRA